MKYIVGNKEEKEEIYLPVTSDERLNATMHKKSEHNPFTIKNPTNIPTEFFDWW